MNMKRILLIVLSLITVIVAGFLVFLFIGLDLKETPVMPVAVSQVPDGTYTGELTGSRFSNKLEVSVNGGKIVSILIVKDMAVVVPEVSSQLFDRVIDSQSLQVDCVSGATVSSKAYLKSLENALVKH